MTTKTPPLRTPVAQRLQAMGLFDHATVPPAEPQVTIMEKPRRLTSLTLILLIGFLGSTVAYTHLQKPDWETHFQAMRMTTLTEIQSGIESTWAMLHTPSNPVASLHPGTFAPASVSAITPTAHITAFSEKTEKMIPATQQPIAQTAASEAIVSTDNLPAPLEIPPSLQVTAKAAVTEAAKAIAPAPVATAPIAATVPATSTPAPAKALPATTATPPAQPQQQPYYYPYTYYQPYYYPAQSTQAYAQSQGQAYAYYIVPTPYGYSPYYYPTPMAAKQ